MYLSYINKKGELKNIQHSYFDEDNSQYIFNLSEPFLIYNLFSLDDYNNITYYRDTLKKILSPYEVLLFKFWKFSLPLLDISHFRNENQIIVNG